MKSLAILKNLTVANTALPFVIVFVLMVAATQSAQAQTFEVLHRFGAPPDGGGPTGRLLLHYPTLYGTTDYGGQWGQGTVFKLRTLDKVEIVLHSFNGADGSNPIGGVIMDAAENLYGVTFSGASSASYGGVYKLDSSEKLTVLYAFNGVPDGAYPMGELVRDKVGNLYGTTQYGGDASCPGYPSGCGTVFKVFPDSSEAILYSFTGSKDGAVPGLGGLVRDQEVNLFGVTTNGDVNNTGTVFRVDKNGTEKVIYRFDNAHDHFDGILPLSGLLRTPGVFYGTTSGGGSGGFGTVFELAQGKETRLYNFTNSGDGAIPEGALATDGKFLYGTTYGYTGPTPFGTVFKLDLTTNQLTVLHTFTGHKDGGNPVGPLLYSHGYLYGTTSHGGDPAFDHGVVFDIRTQP